MEELNVEMAVRDRYSAAADAREVALCCPVEYDTRYFAAIPDEVIERDYGCGDPSRYVRPGETVLDLGSGGGKICFIAAQIVGPEGRVIGVDMNDDMLDLARRSAPTVASNIGHDVTSFRKGRIQDLGLDMDALDRWLADNPVRDLDGLARLDAERDRLRKEAPLVPDASVDIIISNCVLNLVREQDKPALIQEMFRVLKVGGRIAISDIVSDEVVPAHLKADPTLWSGCISGAFHEQELLRLLEEAGFYGIGIDKWDAEPWQTVEGIEFRSVTVTAHKGKEGPCWEKNQAVIYRGPWKSVTDDDGHTFHRGQRAAVCEKTHRIMTDEGGPYAGHVIGVSPREPVTEPQPFDCSRTAPRDPRETKGAAFSLTTEFCGPDCC